MESEKKNEIIASRVLIWCCASLFRKKYIWFVVRISIQCYIMIFERLLIEMTKVR